MGGVVSSIFGGGSKQRQTSKPQDLTPDEFVGLREPVAGQIQNLFAQGGGQTFPGQTAANLGLNEVELLGMLQTRAQNPDPATSAGQNFLQNLITGGQALTPISQMGTGTAVGQENPFLAGAIDAAQRPLIENFQDVVAPALRAQFTGAGQQIQGQGSSPFQMAAARAQSGLANALGDIGAELAFQDLAQRQQLGSQEFQQGRALQTQQEVAGRGQQLDAVSQAAGIDRQQLESTLATLEAQALPRLVEQLGIDRGLEEFRRREEQLLQAIQLAGGIAGPNIAARTSGSSKGESPFGSALGSGLGGAVAAGVGALFSSRDFKDDITPADEAALAEAVRSIDLANFVYKPEMGIPGRFVGAIVEDTPEVFHGADGRTLNAYNLISGLIAASHEKDQQIARLEARLEALEDSHG